MNLHTNSAVFRDTIDAVSDALTIDQVYIEKDYYATLLLKTIIDHDNQFIFKGGTSLSKAFQVVNRFSEDIDLNYNLNPTVSIRRQVSKTIKIITEDLKMYIENLDQIRSKGYFNTFLIPYITTYPNASLTEKKVKIETALRIKSYPIEKRNVQSMIGKYLEDKGRLDLVKAYGLEKFDLWVQSLERTFIDKVFATCDYYLAGKSRRLSRHLYDLYYISKEIDINQLDDKLIENVRSDRLIDVRSLSAQFDKDINEILKRIYNEQYFKTDFEAVTSAMLYDKISYDEINSVLPSIINSKKF